MVSDVCAEVKNYFVRPNDIHASNFVISGGSLTPISFVADGQYYRIVGSAFNDGVYKHGTDDTQLTDEEFFGSVWAMRVPKDFVTVCTEISTWVSANSAIIGSPYQSESFGGYSYSKGSSKVGGSWGWQDQFRDCLNKWRKLSVL